MNAELASGYLSVGTYCGSIASIVGDPSGFRRDTWLLPPPTVRNVVLAAELLMHRVEGGAFGPEVTSRGVLVLTVGTSSVVVVVVAIWSVVSACWCATCAGSPDVENCAVVVAKALAPFAPDCV